MARIDSLSVFQADGTTEYLLAEETGKIIENVEIGSLSARFKNKNLSGDPAAGSVEANRFVNNDSVAYGTARAAGAGVAIKVEPVSIALNQHKEIINEIQEFDLKRIGIAGFLKRNFMNNEKSMIRELDRAFFTAGYQEGTVFVPNVANTTFAQDLEELFVKLETVENDWVDGVDRADMICVLTPAKWSELKNEIDLLPAQDNYYGAGIGMWHEVMVTKSLHMPKGVGQVVDAMVMRVESIAQPVSVTPFDLERVQLSKAIASELFYDYGTKAVTPDLVFYLGNAYVA